MTVSITFLIFTWGSAKPFPAKKYSFFETYAVTFDLMEIGPKWTTNKSKGAIGPNRDTIKSVRTGHRDRKNKDEKRFKVYHIFELATVLQTPRYKNE